MPKVKTPLIKSAESSSNVTLGAAVNAKTANDRIKRINAVR